MAASLPSIADIIQRVMSLEPRNSSAARCTPPLRPCPAPPPPAGRSAATRRCRRRHAASRPTSADRRRAIARACRRRGSPCPASQRHEALADQIEIGDAIDLIVIGNPAVAIAEAGLRPHIELDFAAARLAGATERAPRGPAVARKRPGDFLPALGAARACCERRGRRTARRAQQQRDQRVLRIAHHRLTAGRRRRAPAPVSSRICRPVLARSTI